jgi:RHS repeat-associated protein
VLDLQGLDALDVEPSTGTVLYARADLQLGEGDQVFRLQRTYAPGGGDAALMGRGWVSILDAHLQVDDASGLALFRDGSGVAHLFEAKGEGRWVATEGRLAALRRRGGGFVLRGLGDERTYTFDEGGRLAAVSSLAARAVFQRDGEGRLVRVEGPWGRLDLDHQRDGLVVTAPGGLQLVYRRDARGLLVEVVRGQRYEPYAYDAADRLIAIAGGKARLSYDGAGRVTRLFGEGVAPVVLDYRPAEDAARGLETRVRRGGETTRVFLRADGRRIERVLPTGASHVTILDARNRAQKLTIGELTWTWSYDERGRLVRSTAPEGATQMAYESSATDRPTSVELPDGRTVRFAYDARGQLTALTVPGQGTVRYAYDAQGRLVRTTDARGVRKTLRRDERGFVTAVDAEGVGTLEIKRRDDGSISAVRGPDGRVTKLLHKADGHAVRVVDAQGVISQSRHDARGQLVEHRDEHGRTVRYTWDARGNMLEARDASGVLATFTYDAQDRLVSIADAAGQRVRYARPDANTLVVQDDSAGEQVYVKDALGRVVEERKAGAVVRYRYDEAGKLVERATPRGRQRYAYDVFGRMSQMRGPDGGFRFGYDSDGRLAKLSRIGLRQGVEYRYDAAGDRSAVRFPWGTVRYERDAAGRVVAVRTPEGERIAFDLRPDGRRSAIRYPNGVTTRFAYAGSFLRAVLTTDADGAQLDARRYTWKDGRVASVTDQRGRRTEFAYDARGQLVRSSGPDGEVGYTYDGAGNRIAVTRGDASEALGIGQGNRVVRRGDVEYRYGPTGALTESVGPEGTTRYTYDVDDRLLAVDLPGGERVRYGYAPNGARLWRQGQAGRTDYIHDLAHVAGELRGGEAVTRYVHGPGVDDVLAARRGGQSFYYHHDLVRSVTSLTDGRGRVAARYAYDAFGGSQSAEGPAAAWNPFRYTSRAQDATTGLYHYRARTYAPELGRFTSPDPYGRKGGLNLYAYVGNQPTALNDPYGLWPEWLDRGIEAVGDGLSSLGRKVVDVAEGAYNLAKRGGEALVDGVVGGAKMAWSFGKGFVQGAWSGVKGIYNMVRHPIQTYEQIKWAVQNWDQVKQALGDKWDEYVEAFHNDPEKFAEMTGHLMGELTVGLVGTKGIDKIAKVGAVARTAQAIGRTRPVTALANGGRRVAGAAAPVVRATAPVLRPVLAPVVAVGKAALKPFDMLADGVVNTTAWALTRAGTPIVNGVRRAVGRGGRAAATGAGRGGRTVVTVEAGSARGLAAIENLDDVGGSASRFRSREVPDADVDAPRPRADADADAPRPRDEPGGAPVVRDPYADLLGTSDRVGDFTGIRNADVEDIVSRVPRGAEHRILRPEPGKVTEGFEYKWRDADGNRMRLRVHGPDASAPAGSHSANGWVARLQRRGEYMDDAGTFHHKNVHNERSPHFNPDAANATHIPVEAPTRPLPRFAPRAPSSSESLNGLLDDVWRNRDELAGQGYRPIYERYNATSQPNPLATTPDRYLDDVAAIAEGRPVGAVSNTQRFGGEGNALRGMGELRRNAGGMGGALDNTFYRFERAGRQPGAIRDRVYINASADTAPELMERLVRDVIDDPAAFPGVELGKISGPGAVGGRAENIVLYTTGPEASARVLSHLDDIRAGNPGYFMDDVPLMTQPHAPGIATGAEPLRSGGAVSFGSVRANAIAKALEDTVRSGGTRADFDRLVRDYLRRAGVDPDAPHANLPAGG